MVRHTTSEKVGAKITVTPYKMYVGVKAREELGVGYGDKVAVTFENMGIGNSDITVSGCLTSSHQFQVPREVTKKIRSQIDEEGRSQHTNAIVEDTGKTWDEENEVTKVRWESTPFFPAKRL